MESYKIEKVTNLKHIQHNFNGIIDGDAIETYLRDINYD